MARSIVWFLLLSQAASVARAGWGFGSGHQGDHADNDEAQQALNLKVDHAKDYADSEPPLPGADLVEAALLELQKVPKSPYERQNRPSGLVATVVHYVMKTIPTGPAKAPSHDKETTPPKGGADTPLSHAVELLHTAAKLNNSDALYLLADMNYFGSYGYPRDLRAAFDHYHNLASLYGNSTAQYMMAVYYSTGLGDVVPRDQARALLYHTFAAAGGNMQSEMAIGFRYHSAVGVVKSCEKAVAHYKRVADKAIQWHRSGPPGGKSWVQQAWRISDDDGGIYGEGASASSAGLNAGRSSNNLDANAAIGDVIEYLDLISQKGDYKAALNLGRIYYEGQRGLDQDLDMAKKYFFLVASRYWRRDGRIVENYKPGIEKIAGKAAAYIGRMYLRGEGVTQNFEKAKLWFERGLPTGDPLAQYGLGLISIRGFTGKKNVKRAMDLFKASAEQDFAPAQVEMGKLYLDQGGPEDLRHANNYFELATRYGNIEAYYYLGEMVNNAVGREKLCGIALNYYKLVAEKVEPLVSSWADANDAYEARDYETAFLGYLLAAEQGYEKAQTNVAYMLDSAHSQIPVVAWLAKQLSRNTKGRQPDSILNNDGMALIQWTRSSRQSNIDSTVKMGDYYYYGVGTDRDISKAVQCYTAASDHSQSAQALFNLGWMYENGVGLVQDFHLAKRYYDHALALNKEAYLPVTLSLLKLRVRSAWNTLTHGEIHSIQEEPKKDWSLSEWIANFIKEDGYYDDDIYADDLYDDGYAGGDDDFEDDGVVESVLILGIMATLVFLLWWRQRIQQQAEEARRREQGLPPQPPAANRPNVENDFRQWAAGGIGL